MNADVRGNTASIKVNPKEDEKLHNLFTQNIV